MLFSLIILLVVTVGGVALAYVFDREDTLLSRIAVGHVIGTAIFGTFGFLLALLIGHLTYETCLAAAAISLVPTIAFGMKSIRSRLVSDFRAAIRTTDNVRLASIGRFCFYIAFLALFIVFFSRAMVVRPDGIFTGAVSNFGDLPAHLGAISAFIDGPYFPPDNPSFGFTKFSYPILVDLIAAMMVELGGDVSNAMFVQNIALGFSLLVMVERFVNKVLGDTGAGKLAASIFFFSGGLGFVFFFYDFFTGHVELSKFIWNLPRDYTISQSLRWGNPLLVLFITQRSFLLGMPLTIYVLTKLWRLFSPTERLPRIAAMFVTGVLAGSLPLMHVHSLAAIFIFSAAVVFFHLKEKWKHWGAFAAGVCIVAIPELIWLLSGSSTRMTEFIGLMAGWENGTQNLFAFWLMNTGILIPLLASGLYLIFKSRASANEVGARSSALLIFYVPFGVIFLISNFIRLAPWSWDNIKVLIYWFVGSLPIVCLALMHLWRGSRAFKAVAIAFVALLTFSGVLDVWRVSSGQLVNSLQVFDRDAVILAQKIRETTPKEAIIVTAPIHNPPTVLTGRRSVMRYTGHLFSYGIDYKEREADVKAIYQGTASADAALKKYDVSYILLGPQEMMVEGLDPNLDYLRRFPVAIESGDYKLLRVR